MISQENIDKFLLAAQVREISLNYDPENITALQYMGNQYGYYRGTPGDSTVTLTMPLFSLATVASMVTSSTVANVRHCFGGEEHFESFLEEQANEVKMRRDIPELQEAYDKYKILVALYQDSTAGQ